MSKKSERFQDKVAKAREQIEQAVADLRDSDQFKSYLRHGARFHTYSPNNQLLIWFQSEGQATKVAGFRKWLTMGRCVRKGETALYVYAPMFRSRMDPATGELVEEKRFGLVAVFDVAQTDVLPDAKSPYMPLEVGYAQGDEAACAQAFAYLLEVARTLGATVAIEPPGKGARADYSPKHRHIRIMPEAGMAERVALLAHELAHHLQPREAGKALPYDQAELVAEAVAFVVGQAVGIETELRSATYIAAWQEGNHDVTFQQGLTLIQKSATAILSALEKVQGAWEDSEESEAA